MHTFTRLPELIIKRSFQRLRKYETTFTVSLAPVVPRPPQRDDVQK